MKKQLTINAINRTIGTLMVVVGVKKLRQAQSEFTTTDTSNNKFYQALKSRGIDVKFSPKDITYRYTSWENWQKIIKVINGIVKHFKWESEVFDCDNRSDFASALTSLVFRINTLGKIHCSVFDAESDKFLYGHWANILVDIDDNLYLFDLDQSGMCQKITSNNCVMGRLKYRFKQIIIN